MDAKVTTKLEEIKPVLRGPSVNAMSLVQQQLQRFNLPRVSFAGRAGKLRPGYPVHGLFLLALVRVLVAVLSVKRLFDKGFGDGASSRIAFFRFLSDPRFHWRQALAVLNRQIAGADDTAAVRGVRAFIIDDTISAHYGRRMEGSSKVHDHSTNTFRRGFKLPVLAYHNGNYTRVLDFAVVRERLDRVRWRRERDAGCPAAARKRELDQAKPSLVRDMLTRAVRAGYQADFVLTDSWFNTGGLVLCARQLELEVLGMLKLDHRRKCIWRGRETTLGKLLKQVKARGLSRCRRFGTYYGDVVCEISGMGEVRLFFSRRGRRGAWKALVTTKLEMEYVQAIEIYAVRWTIEVLFKECKSLLGLDRCQCKSFNAQIAHLTTVFMLHALLVSERNARDYRSLGELFRNCREELDTRILSERIIEMLEAAVLRLAEQLGGADTVTVRALLESPEYAAFKEALGFSSIHGMFMEDAA